MSLISILIALVVETYYHQIAEWRKYEWFNRYHEWMQGKLASAEFTDGPVGVVINLAVILFAVWLVDAALGGVLGLFSFVFGVIVLLYCIGPVDIDSQAHHYMDAIQRGDTEAANFYASELYGEPIEAPPEQVQQIAKHAILTAINSRVISVIFWFTLLGPVGAMLYRLTQLLRQQYMNDTTGFAQSVHHLYNILIWIPARICVFSFALAGNFVDTFSRWKNMGDFLEKDSDHLIVESGMGAIQQTSDIDASVDENPAQAVEEVLALTKRGLIVCIAILAVFTIAGWLA